MKTINEIIKDLEVALNKFQECPDVNRAWEMDFNNSIVFAIDDLKEIKRFRVVK